MPVLLAELFMKLKAAEINAELHIYNSGGLGVAVRPRPFAVSGWPIRFVEWLRDRGFTGDKSTRETP